MEAVLVVKEDDLAKVCSGVGKNNGPTLKDGNGVEFTWYHTPQPPESF